MRMFNEVVASDHAWLRMSRFHLELVFPGRKITKGDIIGVCKRIPGVLESFQHIGIFHLVDQGIVLDVEPDTETYSVYISVARSSVRLRQWCSVRFPVCSAGR